MGNETMEVLIVEDDPVSGRLLEIYLRKYGYGVQITRDGREALEALQKPDAPHLVISDWIMPHMDGIELCKEIRKTEGSSYIYFIIITSKGRREDVIEGLEAGADDFLIKPFDQEELKCRVKIGERIIKLEQRILELANTDALTGALNRRAFMERMKEEIHRSRRENTPLSLLLADIDYFKRINDSYGHQVGDLVLRRFADQLTMSSRPYDFTARYGGEEFVVCLPGADLSQAMSAAERIRERVEEMGIMLPDISQSIRITASFGAASSRVGLDESVDSIIGRADHAMYTAKNDGRNRVCMASEE